jgi:hypothetical protein
MAKKKTSASNGAAAKATVKKPKAAKPAAITTDAIGDAAGKVWHALAAQPLTLAALKKTVDVPEEVVLAAIGWLAREGKLAFDSSGRSATVSLR